MFFKRKNNGIDNKPKIQVKEGDILVDKEFGEAWNKIKIIKIGASGKRFLYQFLIVNGKKAFSGDMYEGYLPVFLDVYSLSINNEEF